MRRKASRNAVGKSILHFERRAKLHFKRRPSGFGRACALRLENLQIPMKISEIR
jgi:hypothetical protein